MRQAARETRHLGVAARQLLGGSHAARRAVLEANGSSACSAPRSEGPWLAVAVCRLLLRLWPRLCHPSHWPFPSCCLQPSHRSAVAASSSSFGGGRSIVLLVLLVLLVVMVVMVVTVIAVQHTGKL